ncbi:hypothetical protein MPSEU_000949800 [Mayamaea pseudoterrestris]|nr:hypothetical protein MPSEU_000949800 [Mayamaea pseudoterrestris]
MSESSLRNLLARVDGTAPSITAAAASMMKHYDRSAGVAVNEWRNSLQTARPDNLLPLLYVANEVLQNSKRNRGNKFLEAMSPIIGQALQHICQSDPSAIEKVRRTVKIWADRRVFSVRFVNELLQGLDAFRSGAPSQPAPANSKAASVPATTAKKEVAAATNSDDDDILDILEDKEKLESESDDEDDVFGNDESEQQKLELDISMDSSAFNASSSNPSQRPSAKRRRSSTTSVGSVSRKRAVLSISGLLEILNRLSTLQQSFERAQLTLRQIDQSIAAKDASELAGLWGDDLQKEFRQNTLQQQQIQQQRRLLHEVAQEKHTLEQEVARYLPWFDTLVKQDDDDLDFCDRLEQKIISYQKIQPQIRKARSIRREEERVKKEKEDAEERKRREEEDAERFRQAALKRETEEKPGMIWNPASREYQVIQTDESWRDH